MQSIKIQCNRTSFDQYFSMAGHYQHKTGVPTLYQKKKHNLALNSDFSRKVSIFLRNEFKQENETYMYIIFKVLPDFSKSLCFKIYLKRKLLIRQYMTHTACLEII